MGAGVTATPDAGVPTGPRHSMTISTSSNDTGTKPGIYTTEFWSTVATAIGAGLAAFGPDASAISGPIREAIIAVGGVTIAVYTVARTILKIRVSSSK